jgi:hypothetical protein
MCYIMYVAGEREVGRVFGISRERAQMGHLPKLASFYLSAMFARFLFLRIAPNAASTPQASKHTIPPPLPLHTSQPPCNKPELQSVSRQTNRM